MTLLVFIMEALGLSTSTPWMIVACFLAAVSVVMMFVPRLPACIVAYLALWADQLSGYVIFSNATLIFWGVAVVLVVANNYLLPRHIRYSRRGLGYIAAGALVGMALGLIIHRPASVIGGSVLGALIAAIAYARTSRGAVLEFPTMKFFNYLGAKGIPAVMCASMVGLILSGFILYID